MDATTPATPPFRLVTLGRIALETPTGDDADLGRRRRKLALLAVLALSPSPLSRDVLAEMFWGDEDPDRARHSLSDALSHLRRVLGRDAIAGRSEVVQLDARGVLAVDALELAQAFDAGDYARVRELYGGPFLENFTVDRSENFERWVTPMRERYATMFARAGVATAGAGTGKLLSPRASPRRRIATIVLGTAVAAAILGFVVAMGVRQPSALAAATPVVALTDVWTDPADTSIAWLDEGLKQMIAADLGRVASAGVVAPAVVREVAAARRSDSLSADESVALAQRLHADWAASAAVSRKNGAYVVALTLRDVANRTAEQRYTVSGKDILVVADQAAAKMLSTLDVGGTGPRLSDVETANTDAYRHFVRSEEAHAEGRYAEEVSELDAAIAADSGFTSAIVARLHIRDGNEYRRLRPLFDRAQFRMTQWDRLSEAVFEADHSGQPRRAELLARQLVDRYPRDPRALRSLAGIYAMHAMYASAESTYLKLIALDSPVPQGPGPCWACDAYLGLSDVRHLRGDYAGQIEAARRWTTLRPASAIAWLALASALELNGQLPAAETAVARYRQLVGENQFDPFTGRMLVMGRRFDEAESYARRYLSSDRRSDAYDLLETVLRERGQFRAAIKAFEEQPPDGGLNLVYGHTLGAVGADSRARAVFEQSSWHPPLGGATGAEYGNDARGFTWNHALAADATWNRADTVTLRALADSVERIGAWSYYARDWSAFHHIRGLIAERAGRLDEARRDFELALSLVPGWTRSNVELAKVDVALGAPDRAIQTLRKAYHEPLDAMGRYAPRSELDYQMAVAFARANQLDSARTYASYVRAAWVHADPEFQQRLSALP
jgi:DNA-binding SARP family transcriptional activator